MTFSATVKEIGQTVRQKGLSYPLTIVIQRGDTPQTGSEAEILPGITGSAEVTLRGNSSTIVLPSAALIPGPDGDGAKESAVWVINDQMRLERHPVHIKTFTEEGAVVEDGLAGGEKIVGEKVRTE